MENSALIDCPEQRAARVLIVDDSLESREVLKTVLERRGLQILEASQAGAGMELARDHHPEVIVVDADLVATDGEPWPGWLADDGTGTQANLVVLGRIPAGGRMPATACVLTKPYHYGPLVRTIEQFVEQGVQDGVAVCNSRARPGKAV